MLTETKETDMSTRVLATLDEWDEQRIIQDFARGELQTRAEFAASLGDPVEVFVVETCPCPKGRHEIRRQAWLVDDRP